MRADAFRNTFLQHLAVLRSDPSAYGELSVRSILELRQQCLREFHFTDIYAATKHAENGVALAALSARLRVVDALAPEQRPRAVLEGLLAGNCFDWGAQAAAQRLDKNELNFEEELERVRGGGWLVDHSEAFAARLTAQPFKHVIIFVDNAGADVVLGVLPFARLLLQTGATVVLAANTYPVLNDITAPELRLVLQHASQLDETLGEAYASQRLKVLESGSGSPCIDLLRLDKRLVDASANADLVVLEGMGRAIHSNYEARFSCDTLKTAMIKNAWLAQKLGGNIYDVVCRFDQRSP
jgi:type II pantothenate kinase